MTAEPFTHPCQAPGCIKDGGFGEGVSLRKGIRGTWRCHEHWQAHKAELAAAKNERIEPTPSTVTQGELLARPRRGTRRA